MLGHGLGQLDWKAVEALVRGELGSLAFEVFVYHLAQQVNRVISGTTSTGLEMQYGEVTLIRSPDRRLSEGGQDPILMQDFEAGHPLSVMVSVTVSGHEVQALVDAGACVNVSSPSFVEDIGLLASSVALHWWYKEQ